LEALAASPHLGRLRHLSLAMVGLHPKLAPALAGAAWLGGLESLDLRDNRLRDAGVKELVAGGRLARLQRLDLGNNGLGRSAVEALAASDGLGELRWLTLGDEKIGDAGARALAASPHLAGLRGLSLQTELTATGLKSAGASRLERLESLRLDADGRAAAQAAVGLFGTPANLDLQRNELSDAGVKALAAMPGLSRVVRLDLSFNQIGDKGAKALAESPHLAQLEELGLYYNDVGPAGVEALFSGGLPRLARINLGSNPVKAEGIKRLAAALGAENLTSLSLMFGEFGDASAAVLARSPRLANLRSLDLANNRISFEAAVKLMSSPALPRLSRVRFYSELTAQRHDELRAEAARRGITLAN
jgi:Ran GTPase-activating protein (RanGAP) involved in mRNA processing and transport